MKERCLSPRHCAYEKYRNIEIHEEWVNSFEAFLDHVGEPPTKGHTLDRIDNTRGYVPGNVRWATRKEQARNRSNTVMVEIDGKRRKAVDLSDAYGVPLNTIYKRLLRGITGRDLIKPSSRQSQTK